MDHRGKLAELLTTRFTDWQLIVLTHDHQFYDGITRRAQSWKKYEFTSWSYDAGPHLLGYQVGNMLEKANIAFQDGDKHAAAAKGRRALEELLQEICELMGAPVPFRRGARNDIRDATEMMKGVRRAIADLSQPLKGRLSAAANELLTSIEADLQVAFNAEVHAGPWQASGPEVGDALTRIAQFDELWCCPSCSIRGWGHISNPSIRCSCGTERFVQ